MIGKNPTERKIPKQAGNRRMSAPATCMANTGEVNFLIDDDNKRVSFTSVEILEFSVRLGENPACLDGTAVELGDELKCSRHQIDFDEYENSRPPRRDEMGMLMTRRQREDLLLKNGFTMREIMAGTKANLDLQKQKSKSLSLFPRLLKGGKKRGNKRHSVSIDKRSPRCATSA